MAAPEARRAGQSCRAGERPEGGGPGDASRAEHSRGEGGPARSTSPSFAEAAERSAQGKLSWPEPLLARVLGLLTEGGRWGARDGARDVVERRHSPASAALNGQARYRSKETRECGPTRSGGGGSRGSLRRCRLCRVRWSVPTRRCVGWSTWPRLRGADRLQ